MKQGDVICGDLAFVLLVSSGRSLFPIPCGDGLWPRHAPTLLKFLLRACWGQTALPYSQSFVLWFSCSTEDTLKACVLVFLSFIALVVVKVQIKVRREKYHLIASPDFL